MSDSSMGDKPGPALKDVVHEVQGSFPSDAAMQDALGRLTLAGYDRADFSLPHDREGDSTPNEGADNPVDDIDKAQLRTMGASMAGITGAIGAAGVTVATGGAALVAAAAAAAVGIGSAVVVDAAGAAASRASGADRDARAEQGMLILAVRTRTAEQVAEVEGILRIAGATGVEQVSRGTGAMTTGVSSASWTGA